MLNSVILIGRLVRDPDMRYTATGKGVCGFTLAVDRPFANQDGEREADFLDVVAWGKLAETCANHLSKGRLVAVRGRLQVRSYETQDGQRRRVAEVVADDVRFLDRAPGADRGTTADTQAGEELADFGDVTGLPDDDIPF